MTISNPEGKTGNIVSKENIFVRDTLKSILGSETAFIEELFLKDALH